MEPAVIAQAIAADLDTANAQVIKALKDCKHWDELPGMGLRATARQTGWNKSSWNKALKSAAALKSAEPVNPSESSRQHKEAGDAQMFEERQLVSQERQLICSERTDLATERQQLATERQQLYAMIHSEREALCREREALAAERKIMFDTLLRCNPPVAAVKSIGEQQTTPQIVPAVGAQHDSKLKKTLVVEQRAAPLVVLSYQSAQASPPAHPKA